MRSLVKFCSFLLVLTLLPVMAAAAPPDRPDSNGTEFWVAIPTMAAANTQPVYKLLVTSPTGGSVTVSDRSGTQIASAALTAGATSSLNIPPTYAVTANDDVTDQGLRVSATAPVSVILASENPAAAAGLQYFPIDALGRAHRILAYDPFPQTTDLASRFTVMATVDNTEVTITPSSQLGTHAAGVPYDVSLAAGQVYQLSDIDADVTGTSVVATAPIVVYGGSLCSQVPSGHPACNPLAAQLPPTSAWGTEFITARFAERVKGDTYRVLADEDDTTVSVDGTEVATLAAGEFYEAVLPAGISLPGPENVHIQTSKPALVAHYGNGQLFDMTKGDPMMIIVPPLAQYLSSYSLPTPAVVDSVGLVWINVVALTADVGSLTLDGVLLDATEFTEVPGTDYSTAQLPVGNGHYSMNSPHPFGVEVYAWGLADAFGYSGGSAWAPIAVPPPVAVPLTSSGKGTQSVSVSAPTGGAVALVDGGSEVSTVTVPEGTYLLDGLTDPATISFVPDSGFTGVATPATYRLIDAYHQISDSTYTPTVLATVTPPPAGKNPRAALVLPGFVKVTANKHAAVSATCKVKHAKLRKCQITLVARVNGDLVTTGRATKKLTQKNKPAKTKVRIELNAVGRSLAASPGGFGMQGRMVLKTTKTKNRPVKTLRNTDRTRVVAKRFTLTRPALFRLQKAALGKADQRYLRQTGQQIKARAGRIREVICTGYADSTGDRTYNRALGKRRARATCAALQLPKRVKVVIRTLGERHPVATNTTAEGRARNRRATITLVY